ncbi:MAG: hypothetical protein LBM08_09515 [Dysgonamonadaceae bacterium]|jgi:hypothetical protein|nr:hypothetical protein [Dysgonamonadaceae bacterium]
MALDNFTRVRNPFTGELLTDENTIYIDAEMGDDLNPGTRAAPKKSLASINTPEKTYLLKGIFHEDAQYITGLPSIKMWIIGEPNTLIDSLYLSCHGNPFFYVAFLEIGKFSTDPSQPHYMQSVILLNCRFKTADCIAPTTNTSITRCFAENLRIKATPTQAVSSYCTIGNLTPIPFATHAVSNFIVYSSINLYDDKTAVLPNFVTLRNTVIRKSVSWQWLNSIIPISWTEPGNEIQDVKASLYAYADDVLTDTAQQNYLKRMADGIFGEGTIIYDDSEGKVRLFNGYDAQGNITDYTPSLQNGNPALFISDIKSCVGCYRPNIKVEFDFDNVENIDDDGNVIGVGDLLKSNNGIFCNIFSEQKRNRVMSTVVIYSLGDRFTRFQCDFSPSEAFYLGALQPDPSLGKINGIVVQPYDDPDTPSAYPTFCAPVNEEVQMAYFLTGDKAGQPVLFSDLEGLGVDVNKNLTEVGAWAVTNSHDEWDGVITLPGITSKVPKVRYFKLHLIANRV